MSAVVKAKERTERRVCIFFFSEMANSVQKRKKRNLLWGLGGVGTEKEPFENETQNISLGGLLLPSQ